MTFSISISGEVDQVDLLTKFYTKWSMLCYFKPSFEVKKWGNLEKNGQVT